MINNNLLQRLILSQNLVLFASSMIFPYYVLFIKQTGANFVEFGYAYALFAVTSAITHIWVGKLTDRFGASYLLAISCWGTAVALLFFPSVSSVNAVYILQAFLGILNAFQKTAEKTLVASITTNEKRGDQIGKYHAWTTMFGAVGVIIAGYTIEIFGLAALFYASSVIIFIGGFVSLTIKTHNNDS